MTNKERDQILRALQVGRPETGYSAQDHEIFGRGWDDALETVYRRLEALGYIPKFPGYPTESNS